MPQSRISNSHPASPLLAEMHPQKTPLSCGLSPARPSPAPRSCSRGFWVEKLPIAAPAAWEMKTNRVEETYLYTRLRKQATTQHYKTDKNRILLKPGISFGTNTQPLSMNPKWEYIVATLAQETKDS